MKEEVKKVLKMVEEKTITADEAERLLETMEPDETAPVHTSGFSLGNAAKFLKIHVVEDGADKVNINLPITLVEVGLKLGVKFAPELEAIKDVDFKEIVTAIRQGAQGKLMDINDGNTTVTITVE